MGVCGYVQRRERFRLRSQRLCQGATGKKSSVGWLGCHGVGLDSSGSESSCRVEFQLYQPGWIFEHLAFIHLISLTKIRNLLGKCNGLMATDRPALGASEGTVSMLCDCSLNELVGG